MSFLWVSNPLEWLFFYAGLPKPNATLLLYLGLGPAMLRRLRRESLPVSIGGQPHLEFWKLYLINYNMAIITSSDSVLTCKILSNNSYACNRCHKLNTSFGRSSITEAIGQSCLRGCQNLECPKPESKKEFLFSKALQSWVYPQSVLPSSIISAMLSSTAREGNQMKGPVAHSSLRGGGGELVKLKT